MTTLHHFDQLIQGTILKRPSRHIKSPYIADALIEDIEYIVHSPSLGCCGLADKDAMVCMEKMKSEKTKSAYAIQLSVYNDQLIGIHPKLGEHIVYNALFHNCFEFLPVRDFKKEQTLKNSRFDFMGTLKDGSQFILEVKSVPLSQDGISYFPDGYRKKKTDTVSPRALKHIQELEAIKKENPDIECVLCFVIQRDDIYEFRPSAKDEIYKQALQKAWMNGVVICGLQTKWVHNEDHSYDAVFKTHHIPMVLFDEYGPFIRESNDE